MQTDTVEAIAYVNTEHIALFCKPSHISGDFPDIITLTPFVNSCTIYLSRTVRNKPYIVCFGYSLDLNGQIFLFSNTENRHYMF